MRVSRKNIIGTIAFFGLFFILAQLVGIMFSHPICGSQGCQAIEQVARIPHIFELIGIAYCLLILVLTVKESQLKYGKDILGIVLLGGLAAESVLIGYQAFIIHEFCKFCLTFAAMVAGMNVAMGFRHFCRGVAVVATPLIALSLIGHSSIQPVSVPVSALDNGTWAVCNNNICNNKKSQECRYLIYSPACNHCNVLLGRLGDLKCSVHFNPIKKLSRQDSLPLPAKYKEQYNVNINQNFLKNLGIETIPVMIVRKTEDETQIISGDRNILQYLQAHANNTKKGVDGNLLDSMFGLQKS
ncbi:MAG: hypothetical protein U9P37_06600 [Pseudomonadota bacterium]|nr:hypothetical protein [Pseudomonadota bacterium]